MEKKQSFIFTFNLMIIIAIIILIILMIMPTNNFAFAQGISSNWNYPSSWSKLGGDQDFQVIKANRVYAYERTPENSNCFQSNGIDHSTITMDDVRKAGEPAMFIKRTILKGYFEGSWYVAILIDLKMDPSNNYSSSTRIRSANATIETQLCQAKKVGQTIVTYWPVFEVGGYLQEAKPESSADIVNESVNFNIGGSLGQNNSITGSFSIGYINNIPRLLIYSGHKVKNNKLYGHNSKYLYYRPDENNISYTESSSTLKYAAIYRCEQNVEFYDLRVLINSQFYYRNISSNAIGIVRAERVQDFFIKPSTNFYKTYI